MDWPHGDRSGLQGRVCPREKAVHVLTSVPTPVLSSRLGGSQLRENALPVPGPVSWEERQYGLLKDSVIPSEPTSPLWDLSFP